MTNILIVEDDTFSTARYLRPYPDPFGPRSRIAKPGSATIPGIGDCSKVHERDRAARYGLKISKTSVSCSYKQPGGKPNTSITAAGTWATWEQDMFRRVYTQPDLVEKDYVEILAMIKAANEIDLDAPADQPVPLTVDHVLHQADGADPVVLGSIDDIRSAMQLASGQTLTFAVDGHSNAPHTRTSVGGEFDLRDFLCNI